ncbi:MAG: hypothetical protein KC503_15155 [Myxococcales bacterium]|nr:hypothetical protein [Myxococcales bacterium]
MARVASALAAIMALATLASATAEARSATVTSGPFTFTLPPGWRDVSPGVPAAKLADIPAALVERARRSRSAMIAFDLAGANDGFVENVNARIARCPAELTEASVKGISANLAKRLRGQAGGARVVPLKAGVTTIGGVRCGRVVQDLDLGTVRARQLVYYMPAGKQCAVVTYSAGREAFARYRPIFEASANATRGLRAPEQRGFWSRILHSAGRGALIGGIAGGLAVLLAGLFVWVRRRKR